MLHIYGYMNKKSNEGIDDVQLRRRKLEKGRKKEKGNKI